MPMRLTPNALGRAESPCRGSVVEQADDMMNYFLRLFGWGSSGEESGDATENGDRVLKYVAGLLALIAASIYSHYRASEVLNSIGPAVFWTGMLVLLLFGLNRHLFHARWFWLVSVVMMGIHLVLVKLLYRSIANANAWTILGVLVPEWLLMSFPYAWLEQKHRLD
jgi:hypothetical protein